jgi:integrase
MLNVVSVCQDLRGTASYLLARDIIGVGGMSGRRIGLREVRALRPNQTIWDSAVAGFGARRQRSEVVSYVLVYRTKEGRQRWHTIGRHGSPWTPETARAEAQRLLGLVVGGADPAASKRAVRQAATVSELCDLYLKEAEAGRLLTRRKSAKKASTLLIDRGRIERHIKPLIGTMKLTAVTQEDVDSFMHDVASGKTAGNTKSAKKRGLARVRGGRGAASRAVGLLGGIFTYAVRRRMRPDNPVHGVIRFADGRLERRLTEAEYAALGEALRKAEVAGVWPPAIAAVRFLGFTGWRRNEALELRWEEIDLDRRTAKLSDTKTGRSMRPLSHAACDVLIQSTVRSGGLVFPATRGDGPLAGFKKMWPRIMKLGGLPADVTPNVLRHSFVSLADELGYSDATIGALVGHKGRTITSRYTHSADTVLLAAADRVADRTAELIGQTRDDSIVLPMRRSLTR